MTVQKSYYVQRVSGFGTYKSPQEKITGIQYPNPWSVSTDT